MFPLRRWLALSLGLASLAQAEPLTFSAALTLAEQHSPRLAAQAARIDAAQAAALPADALPDPALRLGVENFPVSGPDRGSLTQDFMTMRKIGVMQTFPNTAKRQARKEAALAAMDTESAKQRLDRLIVRREAAKAWINRFYLEQRLALFDDLTRENRLLADAVKAQLASGKAMAADAILPRQEAAELEDRRDELARELAEASAMLRRWVGPTANEALADPPPFPPIDTARLRQHLRMHPEIAIFEPMTRMARADVREAEAAKQPDWGVEFSYGQRGEEFGDMVSLQFSADLPVFSEHRQDPKIAAKRSEIARIDAERNDMARMHWAKLDSHLAQYEMLTRQTARMQSQWLPLAGEKVDLQLAGYRAGNVPLSSVLEARRERINQRLKAIELEGKRRAVAVQLQIFYGEEQP